MSYRKSTWFLIQNQCRILVSNQWSKITWWCSKVCILRCLMTADKVVEVIWETSNEKVIYQDSKTRVLHNEQVVCLHSTLTKVAIISDSRLCNRSRKREKRYKKSGVGRMKRRCSCGRRERRRGRVRRKKRAWLPMKSLKGFNRLNEPV